MNTTINGPRAHTANTGASPQETSRRAPRSTAPAAPTAPPNSNTEDDDAPDLFGASDESRGFTFFPARTALGDATFSEQVEKARAENFDEAICTFEGLLALIDGNVNYEAEREALLLLVAGYQRLVHSDPYITWLNREEADRAPFGSPKFTNAPEWIGTPEIDNSTITAAGKRSAA